MIVRMAKIMIMGPLDLLMETLSFIQQLGILQIDTETPREEVTNSEFLSPQIQDKETVLQHQLYKNVRKMIEDLLVYLNPPRAETIKKKEKVKIEWLIAELPDQIREVKQRKQSLDKLTGLLKEYLDYAIFVDAIGNYDDTNARDDVRCIGFRLPKAGDIEEIDSLIKEKFKRTATFDVIVSEKDKKRTLCIIVTEVGQVEDLVSELRKRRIHIFKVPTGLEKYALQEQKKKLAQRIATTGQKIEVLKGKQRNFEEKWYETYLYAREWVDSKLSLINVTSTVIKTRMCFFIYGWLPASDFLVLEEKIENEFGGRVVAEESELVEQDFSRVPTVLHNPVYFEPFELFSRLLPIPPYVSIDITPFIGIFFPVFFGMMLGDMGYGIILLLAAIFLVGKFKKNKVVQDAGKILFVCSLYTIIFGAVYGELLGTIGHKYLGMKPLFFDRQASIVPMLCFAIAAGVIHVIIGLVLGIIVALRRHMQKEAVFKLINIVAILCLCVFFVSHFTDTMGQVRKPLLLTIVVVMPVLLLVGGLMAPLELLKNIGNIISYARIMAVGLTSVLLAYVANYMAGRIGSVWAGIGVAVLLHTFNILLGVFSPTIHSLRLHYVEFLSKFMEPGGREFKPLGRK